MNLLVTGAFKCTETELKALSDMGNNVIFHQIESTPLPCSYEWVEGVIGNGIFLHHSIEKFVNLKYIQLTSAGLDRIPMDYVQRHNITIHNAHGVYSIPIAEFVVCGVLDIYKQSRFFAQNQKEHRWNKCRTLSELYSKTVCIVGSGNVGTECAKRFKAFGTTIYAVDILQPKNEVYDKYFTLKNIIQALSESDIVVLSLPLTEKTKNMFDKKMFSYFKNGSILVNISRGATVNQDDLIYALQNGQLYGAVLDVFETEPLEENSPLWDMESVIVTPHNSFVGENNVKRLKNVVFNNLAQI